MSKARILSLLLTLCLVVGLTAGCGGEVSSLSPDGSAGSTIPGQSDSSNVGQGNTNATTTGDDTGGDEGSTTGTITPPTQMPTQNDTVTSAKDKLDFGGAQVVLIYEWNPTTETGQNQDADRWLARIAEVEEKFNVDIVEKQGANTYDYNSNIVTSILSGDPIGHLISVNGGSNYEFIRAGIAASLDDGMEKSGIDFKSDKYNQMIRQYYNVNNKQYIFGFTTFRDTTRDVSGLWLYNKRIMKQINEDPYALYQAGNWTWDEATRIANKATVRSANGTVTQYGLGISSALDAVINLTMANGGQIGTVNDKAVPTINLNTPATREALEQLYQWGVEDKVVMGNGGELAWDAIAKEFAKGNIALLSDGAAAINICQQQDMRDDFGVVPIPKGPRTTEHVTPMNIGYGWIIPVTYQKDVDKYLLLMDELYEPYEGITEDSNFKSRWIKKFSDADSYNLFKSMYTDTSKQKVDMTSLYGIAWTDPSLATVMGNVMKGSITPGNVVESYVDAYQAMVDEVFDGYLITGIGK